MVFDFIIIGAGSMGMAAGYYISKAGKSVALIDAYDPPHANGSHHGETRIIRHAYGEGAYYIPLALRASQLWNELEKESKRKIFYNTGVLNTGTDDSRFIQTVIASAKEYSLPVEVLTSEEINARWKGFNLPANLIGCFESSSGVLMSEEAVCAYRELAVCNGATLFTNRTVKEIITDQNKVTVNTAHETITGGKLIITAGKGTNQVLSLINEELPLTPTRKTFSWFDGGEEVYDSDKFPAWSYDDDNSTYYGFPNIEGAGVKIGRHDGGQPINAEMPLEPFGTYPEDEQDVVQFTKRNFSGKLKHRQGKVCTYTMTPDEDFIIDLLPSHENIIVACGFSGHGFKFSSVVGEILSQLAINGETKWDISNFSIKRFRS